jgi:cyclic pyranopterin phosphate synthase
LSTLRGLPRSPVIGITTNGITLAPHLVELKRIGVMRLNISLDSLRPEGYRTITRRFQFGRVWQSISMAEAAGFSVKLNVVVLAGLNDHEIPDFVRLTRSRNWTVRFIEPMPFDGSGACPATPISGADILRIIAKRFALRPVAIDAAGVGDLYEIDGFSGRIGIIAGRSRTFCDRCSRLRVSAQGQLRTCLYGRRTLDLRKMLRAGQSDAEIATAVRIAVRQKSRDGVAAEAVHGAGGFGSMAAIGG